mmetsp:Transcript_57687/g.133186  ORF Transcript_57687/g.133186 Transcript_57687/m.133186 type:complete len:353 (-) Transcript_57687:1976-3034(-)
MLNPRGCLPSFCNFRPTAPLRAPPPTKSSSSPGIRKTKFFSGAFSNESAKGNPGTSCANVADSTSLPPALLCIVFVRCFTRTTSSALATMSTMGSPPASIGSVKLCSIWTASSCDSCDSSRGISMCIAPRKSGTKEKIGLWAAVAPELHLLCATTTPDLAARSITFGALAVVPVSSPHSVQSMASSSRRALRPWSAGGPSPSEGALAPVMVAALAGGVPSGGCAAASGCTPGVGGLWASKGPVCRYSICGSSTASTICLAWCSLYLASNFIAVSATKYTRAAISALPQLSISSGNSPGLQYSNPTPCASGRLSSAKIVRHTAIPAWHLPVSARSAARVSAGTSAAANSTSPL